MKIVNWDLSPRIKRFAKSLLLGGVLASYLISMSVFSLFSLAAQNLPDPKRLWERNRPVSVQIVDRNGRDILVRGAAPEQGINLEELPFHIPMVILSTEDKRYYNHVGLDPFGLVRAFVENMKAGQYVQGGSTLTQQLTKNVFLSSDKKLSRKAQELMLTIWLERDFTKNELLEMYLTRVYFGSGAWGLEAASETYFDKAAKDMSLAETAMIAGLLQAPSAYNPIQNPKRAARRAAIILASLDNQGLLDDGVRELALKESITIHRPQSDKSGQHFVDWIWPVIESSIGVPNTDIVVQTTLDIDAQKLAQDALIRRIDPKRGVNNGAVVSLDGTGGVIAMVGGTSYTDSQFNRAVQAKRQPGSAFKPFVYLAALRAGLTPWDVRIDAPLTLEDWSPRNFTEEFHGNVSLKDAFASSINTVAVSLAEEIGRDAVINTARDFGFENLEPYRSLALGAQVSTPLNMASSYLPFINWGDKYEPYGILTISTADGTPLYNHIPQMPKKVMIIKELSDMNVMMIQTVENGTGRRARVSGRQVGGKTGTTNDYRDAWFIGYAPDIVTAVWVGNDDNTPMLRVTGGTIPAEIFGDYMAKQLATMSPARLPVSPEPDWVKKNKQLNNLLDVVSKKIP